MQDIEALCREGEGAALFDMDGTLFAGDLGETSFFLLLASRLLNKEPQDVTTSDLDLLAEPPQGEIAQILVAYSKAVKQGLLDQAYQITSDFVRHLPYSKVFSACKQAFEAYGSEPATFMFDGVQHRLFVRKEEHMLALLQACLQAKRDVYLVSASPLAVVQAFCELFSFSSLICLAADGRHLLPYGRGKVSRLQEAGVQAAHIAFGNSIGDTQMLQMARHGVFRHPGDDLSLLALASQQGWLVIA